jgi:hypothetical protein
MPIKGLTNRKPKFPRLGIIRKGAEKKQGKPGEDLSYFRFDAPKSTLDELKNFYGEQPSSLRVFLPHHDTSSNFPCWMEEWFQSRMSRRCDGDNQLIWFNNGAYSKEPKPCEAPSCQCKEVGRFQVILPELKRLGYFEVQTHSKWDILGLNENLEAVYQSLGSLRGVPMVLSRKEREVSIPRNGSRTKVTKYLLDIEVESSQEILDSLSNSKHQLNDVSEETVATLPQSEPESDSIQEAGREEIPF